MANIVHATTASIGKLLSHLTQLQGNIEDATAFINLMGWELPPGAGDIGLATLDIGEFLEKLNAVLDAPQEQWDDELAMLERIADLTLAVNELVQNVQTLSQELPTKLAGFGDYVERTQIHKELPRRLFDFLVINYLTRRSPLAFALLHLANIIDYPHFDKDPDNFQIEHIRATINYSLIKKVVTDPALVAEEAYGWNTPVFASMRLLQRISLVFQALGLRSRVQLMNPEAEEIWTGKPVTGPGQTPQLICMLHEERGAIAGLRVGFSMFGARPTSEGDVDAGLGIVPIIRGQATASIPFFSVDNTFIELSAEARLLKAIALLIRPDEELELKTADSFSEIVAGRFALGLRHEGPDTEPETIISFPGGSVLQIRQFHIQGGMEKFGDRPAESFMELGLSGGRFAFSMDGADSFLKSGIPGESVESSFDVRIGWRSDNGIYFEGSGGLELRIPVHAELGPFSLTSLSLGLAVEEGELEFLSSVSGNLSLGPVVATVEEVGLRVDVTFGEGNLGIFGLSPQFKPPTGVGLSIDGGGFKGGGFLSFDPRNERYSGVLELQFQDSIALKAIGLITTRLPDGSNGFSLLIIITAEFTPIQLGLGFTLNGVGGLLGLNRTAKVEKLRAGIKENTLSSVLFPQNVVANASRIISDLRQVFPPEEGRFIFGPMARIGWGTPSLITLDMGLVIELPQPVRVLILGVLKAVLPDEKASILHLQVNFLGVIDFEKQMLSFDASLYESKILTFTLEGDMALRLAWGKDTNFLLTVGGFHPAFNPPPLNLPTLARLNVSLINTSSLKIRFESYFAVTSNTAQFGTKLELYAGSGKFNAYGFLAFDTLFQFNPFYFIAQVNAMLALRVGTNSIACISLTLTLEGPTPWNAKGEARLKLFWFLTVKVRFNQTFGEERDTLLEDIEVLPLLLEALSLDGNWEALLPPKRHQLVGIGQLKVDDDEIIVHPYGSLRISQKVTPLGVQIERFGNQKPKGPDEFRIEALRVGGDAMLTRPTREYFAPAQYFDKSDAEKLSSESFVHYDSGVVLSESERMEGGGYSIREVEYELCYIDNQRTVIPWTRLFGDFVLVDLVAFDQWTTGAAVSSSPLSSENTGVSALAPDRVVYEEESYAVVNTFDLSPVDGQADVLSEGEALAVMNRLIAADPTLEDTVQIVPTFEMSSS